MKLSQTIICALAAASVCVGLPSGAAAEEEDGKAFQPSAADPALTEEISFIEALVEANMPDFAEPVIAAAKKKWPNAGPKLKVLELQGDLRLGKFESVQKVVDSLKGKKGQESEYWALRLSMADAYYARGMMPECRKIYDEFFKTVTKPGADLLDFYVESGFRWAQICVREKKFDEAVQMYGNLLTKPLPEERWCMVAMEDVELLLRLAEEIPADPKDKLAKKRAGYLATAEKLVDKLLWKNELILVFGKAISMKAHIEMLRGHPDKAQALVNDYMPQLSEIHRSLVEQDPDGKLGYVRASPMPECRYLLAKMLWDGAQAEAKKPKANEDLIKDSLFGARVGGKRNGLGAYNHAINVYAKYSESSWAADAGEMTEQIAAFVKERYKKEIKTNIPPGQIEKLRKMKYQNAFELYRGQEYEKAVAAYKELLDRVKDETEDSVSARGVLADCYVNLRQNAKKGSPEKADYAKLAAETEDFVATQYKGKAEALVRLAGNETLRLAAKEHDMGERGRAQQLYDAYFANYPEHYNAAQMSYALASQAFKAEDWDTAIRFYTLLATQYPKSPHAVDALQFLAICNEKTGNAAEQEKWLREFANATKKVGARTTAQLNLALMQQKRGFAAFQAAAETNDVEAAEAMRKEAYRGVAGAIRDFRAVADTLAKALETDGKSLDPKDREQYLLRREQAIFLEATSWQRLTWPEAKVSAFRAQAVKAYEKYLEANPKGQYGPQALVKIGTIYTAEKNMEKSQEAFARLQRDFPNSDEAKNSVPRLAKTLIEMGLNAEGVAEYKKMLETTGGKYTAGQFRARRVAHERRLLSRAGTDRTGESRLRRTELRGGAPETRRLHREVRQVRARDRRVRNARAGRLRGGEPREGRHPAHERVQHRGARAQETARLPQDAARAGRTRHPQRRSAPAQDMPGKEEAAKETRGRAIVTFQAYLMAHDPTDEHPAKDMSAKQLENLERCYAYLLPLMAEHGSDKADILAYGEKYLLPLMADHGSEKADILAYGEKYRQLFPNGKHKLAVETVLKPLEGKQAEDKQPEAKQTEGN